MQQHGIKVYYGLMAMTLGGLAVGVLSNLPGALTAVLTVAGVSAQVVRSSEEGLQPWS